MLIITNLTKHFKGNFAATLQGINLQLSAGEFCILVGDNGSGKSTLLSCISGEYQFDEGNINIDKRKVASVTQDINKGTIPEMTCLENMMLGKLRNKVPSLSLYHHHRDEIINTLKEIGGGLENYIDKPLINLSGGQRQMVATLMGIGLNPEVLLLDEHTCALDPKAQKFLMEYTVKAIARKGITTIMVTHKLEDAILYGDRLIMMHKGKIVLDAKGSDKNLLRVDDLFKLYHDYEVKHVQ